METLVVLANVNDQADVGLIQAYLASFGIESVVDDAIATQVWGSLLTSDGVSVRVMKKDLLQAVEKMREGGYDKYLVEPED